MNSLPQLDDFQFRQHSNRPGSGLILRYDQAKPSLCAEQGFAIGSVRQQDLVVDECGVQFSEREYNLVAVLRFGKRVDTFTRPAVASGKGRESPVYVSR